MINKDTIICRICGNEYKHLGSHIWHCHRIKARQYKQHYNLDYNLPLISAEVKEKKQIAFAKDKEKYLANLNKDNCFKKGNVNRTYFSKQSINRFKEQLKELNNNDVTLICPFCKYCYRNLNQHLIMNHNLIINKYKVIKNEYI
jgi:predicted transcriptional regulator